MTGVTMPEPPENGTLVGLFEPSGQNVPALYERDDTMTDRPGDGAHWFDWAGEPYTWVEVLRAAELGWETRRQVVRLYRADDPAVVGAFNAGVEAAAAAIEAHAESVGWYEGSGVWADAIEEARKAVKP